MVKFVAYTTTKLNSQLLDLSDWFGFDPFGWLGISTDLEGNFLTAVKNILTLAAVVLFVVWILIIFYAGFKMITAVGDPDNFGEGITTLKNLIVGIFLLFLFIIVLILIANFFGA